MSIFFPIYNRGSDSLNQARLTSSLQANQARLQELQQQIATGRRIDRISQDPSAGIRAMGFEATIEQSTQYGRNLKSNQAFLAATDTQLRGANDVLNQIRGQTVSWANTTLTEPDRQTALQQLSGFRQQLLSISNTQYQGRFLFAGANTQQAPFDVRNGQIYFQGNDGQLKVPTTAELMVQSNVTAQTAFGGRSEVVRGVPNLQAPLTAETRLIDLRGGQGIQLGSLQISDGYNSSLIDLSTAETVGDVIQRIESAPPAGRHLKLEIVGDHLELRLADDGPENLMVQEANGGRVAADLGIRTGVAQSSPRRMVGQSLSPQIAPTTPLERLTGRPAVAHLASPGANNDIVFRARHLGADENGWQIQYVDSSLLQAGPGLMQGSEQVDVATTPRPARAGVSLTGNGNDLQLIANQPGSYLNGVEVEFYQAGAIGDAAQVLLDTTNRRLRIGIDSNNTTTAQAIVDAINAEGTFTASGDESDPDNGPFDPAATVEVANVGTRGNTGNSGGDANTVFIHVNPTATNAYHVLEALHQNADLVQRFVMEIDPTDGRATPLPGRNVIDATAAARTAGGAGQALDLDAGFQIIIDGQVTQVSLAGARTVEDLINRVAATDTGAFAQINSQRNGLVLGVRQAGVQFSIGENGGKTATELGLRTFARETRLSDLNSGLGIGAQPGTDFTLTRSDGTSFAVDVSGATTVGNVLDRINLHPDNQNPANAIRARLATTGNGIELVQDNPSGTALLSIRRQFGSRAAEGLGLIPPGQEIGYPAAAAARQADVAIIYPDLAGMHRSFSIRANLPGDQYNNIEVEVVSGASGDQATATFDGSSGRLTIQVDPSATRTSTLVNAINQTGLFRGQLLNNSDGSHNNGSGVVSQLGQLGVLSGGNAQPTAAPAQAIVRPNPPQQFNTALTVTANQAGTAFNGYQILVQAGAFGDDAIVALDAGNRQLVVTIDPTATTANTILAAINAEGTFSAALNTEVDPTNDGSGLFVQTGSLGFTAGGAPSVLRGTDVNKQQNQNIFNTIDRLIAALSQPDPASSTDLQAAARLLDQDIDRLSKAMANVGTRQQHNDFLFEQNETLMIDLRASLSQEVELDMVEAISQLTSQQAMVEASLRMIAQTYRTSLLDFI